VENESTSSERESDQDQWNRKQSEMEKANQERQERLGRVSTPEEENAGDQEEEKQSEEASQQQNT
jgi:hypothetical protein